MILTIVLLLIGLLLAIAGIYYLIHEKEDAESRKIYSITTLIGVVLLAGTIVKIVMFGF